MITTTLHFQDFDVSFIKEEGSTKEGIESGRVRVSSIRTYDLNGF